MGGIQTKNLPKDLNTYHWEIKGKIFIPSGRMLHYHIFVTYCTKSELEGIKSKSAHNVQSSLDCSVYKTGKVLETFILGHPKCFLWAQRGKS